MKNKTGEILLYIFFFVILYITKIIFELNTKKYIHKILYSVVRDLLLFLYIKV
jgi:hypothetical protein